MRILPLFALLLLVWAMDLTAAKKNWKPGAFFNLPLRHGLVEVRPEGDLPSPLEFHTSYAAGFGKPFIMKGAAKKMTAFKKWQNDDEMNKFYPRSGLDLVEFAKQETRTAPSNGMRLSDFLKKYNKTDCYAVTQVPREMAKDVEIPDLLKCGYATQYLDVNNMWFSSGGTDSMFHNDDQDNVNCVISGTKRFFMMDPRNKTYAENSALGWTIAGVQGAGGYGAYGVAHHAGDDMLKKYPKWAEVHWYDAPLEAGDCLFIPTSWYHQVHSPANQRSIALNIWWWRRDGPYSEEEIKSWDDCPHRDNKITIADCKFGYEGPPDHPRTPFNPQRLGGCRGIERPSKLQEALSFIVRWQRFPERKLITALRRQGISEYDATVEQMVALAEEAHQQLLKSRPPPMQSMQDDADDGDDDEL